MSTEPQKLPLPALTAVGRGDRDHVAILDSLLRERRHVVPTQNPCKIPSDRAPALCASLRNDTVVHRFEDGVESTCSREGSVVRVQSGLRQWTKRPSSVDFRDALHSELEAGFQHIGWWDFAGWCSARDLSRDASLGSQLCVGRAKWTTPSTPSH